jgi:isopentenyl-diphosphate Delta-isomerase
MTANKEPELIVFVNPEGKPTGQVGPKLESHTANTALHLAFSCYIFNEHNELLVTQRALVKKVWPGVWTNSICGHPMPDESLEEAVQRRASFELGTRVTDLKCVVPRYTYKTPPFRGIIEHEFCPIFTAQIGDKLKPNPKEIEAYNWLAVPNYARQLQEEPDRFSYWCKDQLPHLMASGSPYFASASSR